MSDRDHKKWGLFWKGLRDGIPICLGYLPVSFAFGLMAVENGLSVWVALLISITNLTSAGQFAGTALILAGGSYVEIAITTFVVNVRYMLMSLSLSQKMDQAVTTPRRCILSYGITDEIFAITMQQKGNVAPSYLAGLIVTPFLGWQTGTFLGASATGLLPPELRSALGIAIYAMFLAIIIPPAKKLRSIMLTIVISALLSCFFKWTPGFRILSSGWAMIVSAIVAAGLMAARFPVSEEEEDADK